MAMNRNEEPQIRASDRKRPQSLAEKASRFVPWDVERMRGVVIG
jgi:hypothetical protein